METNAVAAIGTIESQWTDVGGSRIHARVSVDRVPDDAPVVVMVHGVGVSSRYMLPTAERLAPFCRVFAPDLPGFGKSDKPARILSVIELADALAAWLDAVGLERPILFGNSFGCQIIADLAVRRPERVERVVLQGPTVDPQGRTASEQIRRWLRNSPYERPSQTLVIARDYRDCGLHRLIRTFMHALQDRIEDKLPRMTMPTLVVRGSNDQIVPQRWAEDVTRLLPCARLVVIPNAGHTLNYGAPRQLARVLRSFMCEQSSVRSRTA